MSAKSCPQPYTRRYHVKCRYCDGTGFIDDGVDDDGGQGHLVNCGCYRGSVTIYLTVVDEESLYEQLRKALNK